MSESTPINVQAFMPFEGGLGKRITVTTTTTNQEIPGTQAPSDPSKIRLLVTNSGTISVFVRIGQSDVVATLDCLEILPGCAYLLTPQSVAPGIISIAAICESGTTKIQVTSGQGT